MNKRISESFTDKKAFIPFITCGDPSLEMTEQLVYAMEEAGADMICLGIPFSDPTAERSMLQEANERALVGGANTDKIFEMIRNIRRDTQVPLIFKTYANVVFSYGTKRFIKTSAQIGIDGLILPDVPFEEKEEFDTICKQYDLDLISTIAPAYRDRIEQIAKEAQGFVHCVSSAESARDKKDFVTDMDKMVEIIKQTKEIPCVIAIAPEAAVSEQEKMIERSDGVIEETEIIRICDLYGENCISHVKEYMKESIKKYKRNIKEMTKDAG